MDDDIRSRFRGGRSASGSRESHHPAYPVRSRRQTPPLAQTETPPTIPVKPQASIPKRSKKSRRRKSKKKLIIILFVVLVAGLAATGLWAYKKYYKKAKPSTNQVADQSPSINEATTTKPTGTIRFIATGDNLAFDSINSAAKQADGSYDYLPMMTEFKLFFDKADIRLCNETTPGGGDKNGLAISGYPTFNAPIAWSTSLAALGCNVINLASNHTNDKGQPAIDAMVDTWTGQGNILAYAGANKSAEDQAKIKYFNVKGVKFAYLAYTSDVANKPSNAFAVNIYSEDLANKQIAEAHKNADLVLVSMHWGSENGGDITADQDHIAQNLAAQNADVVIGVGPHVLQPAKVLNGKDNHQTLIWFSLGNFLNSELPVENLIGGVAIMDFDAATGKITDPKLLPVYMHYEWTPQQKAAGTINARHDFKLYPLDAAAAPLAKSLNGTTVEAQTQRVTSIITKFVPIKVIKSTEF